MEAKKFIGLYRVSTTKQQDSELGLRAQRFAVRAYVKQINGVLVEEVTEIESAGNKDRINTKNRSLGWDVMLSKRPQLNYAIKQAEKIGATVIVKEPSRLTRFSLLMSYLIEYGIKFVCTDCANDDAMMLKLRTVFNEEENLRRSQRTSSALQQKKRQGFKLGSTTGFTDEMRKKAAVVNAKSAIDSKENKQAMHVICGERKAGKTLQEIADKLNTLEYKTRRGKAFSKTTVNRLFARCASLKSS